MKVGITELEKRAVKVMDAPNLDTLHEFQKEAEAGERRRIAAFLRLQPHDPMGLVSRLADQIERGAAGAS